MTPIPQQTPQPQVRRRITTKTTPSKNGLLAAIDTGVLHLTTNEDAEEKKLPTHDVTHRQHDSTRMDDDDNEHYDAYELKTAIKEENDALQKTEVFTRVNAQDYSQQSNSQTSFRQNGQHLRNLRSDSSNNNVVNPTDICTTPKSQHIHVRHPISLSQHTSATKNHNTCQPPPECEQNKNILWKLNKHSTDFVTHHRSSNYTYHQFLSNLVYDNYDQINVPTTATTSQLWSTWMTFYS
eukprot:2136448-Amphidinium_carterae.1